MHNCQQKNICHHPKNMYRKDIRTSAAEKHPKGNLILIGTFLRQTEQKNTSVTNQNLWNTANGQCNLFGLNFTTDEQFVNWISR